MTKKRGKDCKLYRQESGTREAWPAAGAAPDLVEIENVRDLRLPHEKTEIDASTRVTDWEEILVGLKKAPLEFTMVYDSADADFTAVRDAYFNDTTIAIAVMDGDKDTAGVLGFWADMDVLRFEEQQGNEDAYTVGVMLKPTAKTSVHPEAVTVST